MNQDRKFVDIAGGSLDEHIEKKGSGVFFISFKDPLRDQMIRFLETEIGECVYLDANGRNLHKENGASFLRFLANKPTNTGFIMFTRSVPFTKEAADNFLVKTKDAGVYEILPASNSACPEQAHTLLIQVKRSPLLDD